jgi:Rrf2 family iron-sulfur cluster assembly transcriptional regulator
MILSRTSQYAIQALIYLTTRPAGQSVLCRDIATELGVPSPYLAKVLQNLCHERFLDSTRGRNGGFSLGHGVENINLLDIVMATEGHRIERECLLGHKACQDSTACPMHRKWKMIKEDILTCLRGVTLFHLAKAVQSGQYRLVDLPQALTQQ